jgi:Ca2+-dependent lipid-binding protein
LKLREIDYNKHSTFCERRTGNLLFHLSLNINTYSMQRIHYQRETSDNVGNWIYGMTFYPVINHVKCNSQLLLYEHGDPSCIFGVYCIYT